MLVDLFALRTRDQFTAELAARARLYSEDQSFSSRSTRCSKRPQAGGQYLVRQRSTRSRRVRRRRPRRRTREQGEVSRWMPLRRLTGWPPERSATASSPINQRGRTNRPGPRWTAAAGGIARRDQVAGRAADAGGRRNRRARVLRTKAIAAAGRRQPGGNRRAGSCARRQPGPEGVTSFAEGTVGRSLAIMSAMTE